MAETLDSTELNRVCRRVSLRVAPFVLLLYFVAFLDRVNISFASLTMNRDLGISDTLYGVAAGIFFIGYLLFAVPSNIMLERVGAPRWVSLLMVVWGVVGCATAFVHGPALYIALRFLLGAAESGFLPGMVYYLTRWLPHHARGGILALLYLAIPLSSVVGSPISAAILRMNGAHGLAGWQWLFLLEALPAILLGAAVPWMLDAGPATAAWLSSREKTILLESMAEPAALDTYTVAARPRAALLAVLALTYFTLMIGLYELGFWTPKLLTSHGVPLRTLGWMNALPYAVGALFLLPWCRMSDRRGDRRWSLTISFACAAAGFALTALGTHSLSITLLGLSLAAFGTFVSMPVFWAAVSQRIVVAAAFAIAVINSFGNIGGFIGPYVTGWLLTKTHSYAAGLIATAASLLLGAVLCSISFRRLHNDGGLV